MEQDKRDELLDRLAQEGGDDQSFDKYLERKGVWNPKESEVLARLREVDLPTPLQTVPRPDGASVAADSKLDTISSGIDAITRQNPGPVAHGVVEHQIKVELHEVKLGPNHSIAYVTETTEPLGTPQNPGDDPIQIDSEWQSEFTKTRESALLLTAEQIIEQRHLLNRAIFLINARQQAFKLSLEEVLQTRNYNDRQALLDLDRKYRAKPSSKAKKDKDKAKSGRQESSIGKAASKGVSKGQKTARTLHGLGMDKEAVIAKLTTLGQADEMTLNLVNKLFA